VYGTAWKEDRTETLVTRALEAGFRAIDTANQRKHYVEVAAGDAVAAAIDAGALTREDLFLQTKFTYLRGQDHRLPYDADADFATQVHQSFESSLEHLRTTYIDSYLLHGPSSRSGLTDTDWQVWRAMESLVGDGRVRQIGVSNVTLEQLESLCKGAAVAPSFVQNRCYASAGWNREVRAFCTANAITYQGFSLLTANRRELAHPAIEALAQRLDLTVAQLVFAFARGVGMLALTGTSDAEHMRQDLAAVERVLSDADIATIESIAA
jgi:diketogulonate reductase-like aldo/keto reductase